jgi:hypothetical protein
MTVYVHRVSIDSFILRFREPLDKVLRQLDAVSKGRGQQREHRTCLLRRWTKGL